MRRFRGGARGARGCEGREGVRGVREEYAGGAESAESAVGTLRRWPDLAAGFGQRLKRHAEGGAAADAVGAVRQQQCAAVRFGDLAAEDQADPGAARLGREERHEQVAGVRQARALRLRPRAPPTAATQPAAVPADRHPAAGLAHGVDGVANEVDQQLFELVAVRLDRQRRTGLRRGSGAPFPASRRDRRTTRRRAAPASAAAASPAARRRS